MMYHMIESINKEVHMQSPKDKLYDESVSLFIGRSDVAALLDIHPHTVTKHLNDGNIPGGKRVGTGKSSHWLIRKQPFRDWLEGKD